MLRRVLPVLCVACSGWTAGPSDPTCGEVECAAACAAAEAKVVVPEGGERLTVYEAGRLALAREGLARGVTTLSKWATVLCPGASCEQAIDPGKMAALPGGAYVVALQLRVPPHGTWAFDVRIDCTDGVPDRRERVVIPAVEDVTESPTVPLVTPVGWAGRCDVVVAGPDGGAGVSMIANFSATPEPLVLLTAAQRADTRSDQPGPNLPIEPPTSPPSVRPPPPMPAAPAP